MAYIKNLNYKIENFNLIIPELAIKDHDINLVIGPSGSGKTTLFNLMTGYLKHSGWEFNVAGIDLAKLSIEDKKLGVVFQSYELFPHLTAQENVELVMKSRNNFNPTGQKQLEEFKNILNLNSCWQTKADNLSGGEKQRVSLLRAVLSKPRMLLLDEPFSALDPHRKDEARNLLKKVLEITKITTLMISHDEADLKLFGQNVIRLERGQVV